MPDSSPPPAPSPATTPECLRCDGTGLVVTDDSMGFESHGPCPTCKGSGNAPSAPPAPAPASALDAADAKLIDDLATAAILVGLADDGTFSSATVARRDAKFAAAKAAISERVAQLVAAARDAEALQAEVRRYELAAGGDEAIAREMNRMRDYIADCERTIMTLNGKLARERTAARASRPTEETDA